MNIHYQTNLNNFETACGLPHWPWCLFPGLFSPFPAHTAPGSSGRGPGVPVMRSVPNKTSISRSAAFKPVWVAPDPCADLQQHLHLAVNYRLAMLYDLVEHHFVGA